MEKILRVKQIAKELNIKETQVENAVKLIDEGNTIPFIARYRKEAHGSLTDTQLRDLSDRLTYLRNLEEAKEKAFTAIEAQGKMTPEIEAALANAATMTEVEDIYRPFRPKRRTRASVARERGLEGLALLILEQKDVYDEPLEVTAESYVNDDVPDAMGRLRQVYPNLMCLQYDNKRTREQASIDGAVDAETKTPFQLFAEFFELQNNAPMSDEQSAFMKDLMEKVIQMVL